MKPKLLLTIIALAILTTLSLTHTQGAYTPESPTTGTTTLVSVASDGIQGNDDSEYPAISADGRYVAFHSTASNLVPDDTNGTYDIFVRDRQTATTTRVSVASDRTQGNGISYSPAISADGRYVAFHSAASTLVIGDANGQADVFVHDTQTNQTSLVSLASGGIQGNSYSMYPAISADGRYVAFHSAASNLVTGDANWHDDVFVHDTQTNQTTLVSVASDETQGDDGSYNPAISADGRYVVFHSAASTLVTGDTNGGFDIFLHDRQTSATSRVSVASDGTQGNYGSGGSAISADGRYVAFHSAASNLVPVDTNGSMYDDIFVRDTQTNKTSLVSVSSDGIQGNYASNVPAISADGRYVAFRSYATNLVTGDTNGCDDIFVRDTQTGVTSRVSVASDGTQGDYASPVPAISADGRYVAFESWATNLVLDDINGKWDVFVHNQEIESEANLTINFPDGAPGSYFTVTGIGFPANDTATINVNGHELETVPVDAIGGFSFIFSTTNADEGIYMITASVNPSATTQLILDAAEPIRPQEGTGSIIDIPEGIAFTNQIFLPLLQR
ncbi:MAG: calcium-binding protein [Chloroflexi bacterium]|nr:calcium-binding protein [Chloroflexota bacterium]